MSRAGSFGVKSQDPLTSIAAILATCREGRVAALVAQPTRLLRGRLDAVMVTPTATQTTSS
jgi:hypothetical protein